VKKFLFITLAFFFLSNSAWSKKPRLEVNDDRDVPSAELRRRIRALQEAVIDLQARVDQLEARQGISSPANPAAPVPAVVPSVTCFIETPFDGIYDATEVNEMKARVEAVKACMAKVKSRIHCSAEKVKCGN
jgi:hypothetical protein